MSWPIYCPSPDDCEQIEYYSVGGFHPVDVGDELKDGRYSIVHKLGHGGFSTVWLARDNLAQRFVALKVLAVFGSKDLREIAVQGYLAKASTNFDNSLITRILDRFNIRGPNGRHTCLALELNGPSVHAMTRPGYKVRPDYIRKLARQLTVSVNELHSCSIVVGDLSSSNVLFKLIDIDDWTTEDVYGHFGEADSSPVQWATRKQAGNPLPPNVPKYHWSSIDFYDCAASVLVPQLVLTDLDEAIYIGSSREQPDPLQPAGANAAFAAPEFQFKITQTHTKASDVWALACIFYELRTSNTLFDGCGFQQPTDRIQHTLGEIPTAWKQHQQNLDKDQRVELVDPQEYDKNSTIYARLAKVLKLPTWWHLTVEQRIQCILDTTTQEQRDDPDLGYSLEKDPYAVAPPAEMSAEELKDFTDLLQKILKYLPEERLSIDEILDHPWLNKQYQDLDDMSVAWISNYGRGIAYPVGWWLEEQEEKKQRKDWYSKWDTAETATDDEEEVTFYEALEEQAPEPEDIWAGYVPDYIQDSDHKQGSDTDEEKEEFSVTKLLGLPLPQSGEGPA